MVTRLPRAATEIGFSLDWFVQDVSLGDLVQRTADELLESKNFGMTSLNEVRQKLTQYGLSLRGD